MADTADYYQIHVLQSQTYGVNLSGTNLPAGVQVAITDMQGNPAPYNTPDGLALTATLQPGTYLVRVDGWQANQATQVVYQLQLNLNGAPDNAPALTTGPAPALQLGLVTNGPGFSPTNPSQPVVPPSTGNDNIVLASHQANGVTLPTMSLLQLASGPLGGVTDASGSSPLASGERVAFRLPETPAPAPASLFAALTVNLTYGSVEDSTPPPPIESRNTFQPPPIEGMTTPPSLEALPNSELSRLLDTAVRVPEGVESPIPELTAELAPRPNNVGESEGPSTAETDTETTGDGVLTRMAWITGPLGVGLTWLLYRMTQAPDIRVPPNGTGKDSSMNLEEGAS